MAEGLSPIGPDDTQMMGDFGGVHTPEFQQELRVEPEVGGDFVQKLETDPIAIILPPLKDGYIRYVHITDPENVLGILADGLNYENQGMLSSTACGWANENEVEYSSDDPRFNYPGAKAVVMDIPMDEARIHDNISKAPGIVPKEYIVGVVDAKNEEKICPSFLK